MRSILAMVCHRALGTEDKVIKSSEIGSDVEYSISVFPLLESLDGSLSSTIVG